MLDIQWSIRLSINDRASVKANVDVNELMSHSISSVVPPQSTVTDIMCSGRVRVSLKPLMDDLPIVAAVQVLGSRLNDCPWDRINASSVLDRTGSPISCSPQGSLKMIDWRFHPGTIAS